MYDGINALWLGASLRYLVNSDIIPEYGTDADRRMKKLNSEPSEKLLLLLKRR